MFMTSTFFRRLIGFVSFVVFAACAQAQEYKYEIGGMAGASYYMGDTNKNGFFKGMNPSVGGVFRSE